MNKLIFLLLMATILTSCTGSAIHRFNFSPNCQEACFSRLAIFRFNEARDCRVDPEVLVDKFTTALVSATNFTIVDRADIAKTYDELKFQQGGSIDEKTKKDLQQLGADSILTGTLHTYNESKRRDNFLLASEVHLSAKILKIQTGEVLWSGEILKRSRAKNLGETGLLVKEMEADSASELLDDIVRDMQASLYKKNVILNRLF